MANWKPDHIGTLTPSLNLSDAAAALDFYKAAFGANEHYRMPDIADPTKIMHGEFSIGDSILFFCDEAPDWGAISPLTAGGCPFSLNLYFEDCDAMHAQALSAGATESRSPTTYPWGERSSMIVDPFGYRWAICTQVEEVSPEEVAERLKTWTPG